MNKSYKATGIVIQGMPLGEVDRLVTILSPEYGILRAVAPGARKYKSSLRGRSELFVVNEFLLAKGRSLDKITQAETINSYPGLSSHISKLAASQYLAEVVLSCGLSEHPQVELYELFNEHLRRLEEIPIQFSQTAIFPHLAQAVFHFLAIAGICPQVYSCCLGQGSLEANLADPQWRVGFSFEAGGIINLTESSETQAFKPQKQALPAKVNTKLNAIELTLLQQLGANSLPQQNEGILPELLNISLDTAWMRVERLLRDYTEYHFGRVIRAATLIDALSPLEF